MNKESSSSLLGSMVQDTRVWANQLARRVLNKSPVPSQAGTVYQHLPHLYLKASHSSTLSLITITTALHATAESSALQHHQSLATDNDTPMPYESLWEIELALGEIPEDGNILQNSIKHDQPHPQQQKQLPALPSTSPKLSHFEQLLHQQQQPNIRPRQRSHDDYTFPDFAPAISSSYTPVSPMGYELSTQHQFDCTSDHLWFQPSKVFHHHNKRLSYTSSDYVMPTIDEVTLGMTTSAATTMFPSSPRTFLLPDLVHASTAHSEDDLMVLSSSDEDDDEDEDLIYSSLVDESTKYNQSARHERKDSGIFMRDESVGTLVMLSSSKAMDSVSSLHGLDMPYDPSEQLPEDENEDSGAYDQLPFYGRYLTSRPMMMNNSDMMCANSPAFDFPSMTTVSVL